VCRFVCTSQVRSKLYRSRAKQGSSNWSPSQAGLRVFNLSLSKTLKLSVTLVRRPAKTELNSAQIFHWIRYKFKLSPSLNWPLTLVSSHLLASSRPLLASSFSFSSFLSLVVRLLWSFDYNFYPYKMHVSVNAWDLRKYRVIYALCSHLYFTNQQSNLIDMRGNLFRYWRVPLFPKKRRKHSYVNIVNLHNISERSSEHDACARNHVNRVSGQKGQLLFAGVG